jgi:ribosomal-protein-alanine N-acetyltransferase
MRAREEIEFRPMKLDDLPAVMAIERASFPTPWSEDIFRGDLLDNLNSVYEVGMIDGKLATYAGIWVLNEIGHITTIAVRHELRGQGLGETALLHIIKTGRKEGVEKFTLEVRESNIEAIKLYEKYGFKLIGRRKNYYKEIGEDALVMWTGDPPYES